MPAPDVRRLRRYVIRRAGGDPHPEYARYDGGIGAWLLCDERTARTHDRWRRIRHGGRPWCPVLGLDVTIARDTALQAFFATIMADEWRRLEIEVRRRPTRCLREWGDQGNRLIRAARAAAEGRGVPGKMSGWPSKRGGGTRSLMPER